LEDCQRADFKDSELTMRAIFHAVCLASWLLSGPAAAGRPVFHSLTFDELLDESDIVAVMRIESPLEAEHRTSRLGCTETRQSFRVLEVLLLKVSQRQDSTPPSGDHRSATVRAGDVVSVVLNPTGLAGCEIAAALQNGTGASYYARRYASEAATTARTGDAVVVFLHADGDRLLLAADGAFEQLSRKPLVRRFAQSRGH
jgi:hypothetical protein